MEPESEPGNKKKEDWMISKEILETSSTLKQRLVTGWLDITKPSNIPAGGMEARRHPRGLDKLEN